MVFSGYLWGLARVFQLANPVARTGLWLYRLTVNQASWIYPAGDGFARLLYFRHDEIEYGVPFANYRDCLRDVRALLNEQKYPTVIEVRFTPDHSHALLGPGAGRRTACIELAPSMSRPTDPIFRKFERIVLEHGGQPHLGKKLYLEKGQLETIYGEELMARFQAVRQSQDPDGKFLNEFTGRLFG